MSEVAVHHNPSVVPILLVTHEGVGQALAEAAEKVLQHNPEELGVLEVPMQESSEMMQQRLCRELVDLDNGQGVLVLTDLYGASPTNFVCKVAEGRVRVISGASLGMLLSCLTHSRDDLDALADKAAASGVRGVVSCR